MISTDERVRWTHRPRRIPVMRQKWRDLLFLHWPVPVEDIARLLPPSLTVDTWDGMAWVGLIPFHVHGARPPLFPPVPHISQFPETNLRTYVHKDGQAPGVWFFSLEAARLIPVYAARAGFHLNYQHARMSVRSRDTSEGRLFSYESERLRPGPVPARSHLRGKPEGGVREAAPGTFEHFLVERYLLYSATDSHLYRARVHHRSYPLQDARGEVISESLLAAAGIGRPNDPPLAHFSPGVDVDVFAIERVERV